MKSKRTNIQIVVKNPSKSRTLEQVKAAQARAVLFAENVLEDDDLADERDGLTPEEYAERKRLRIVTQPNPRKPMAAKTLSELRKENAALKLDNEVLNTKLDAILDLAAVEDDDDDDDSDDADDDDDDDDSAA